MKKLSDNFWLFEITILADAFCHLQRLFKDPLCCVRVMTHKSLASALSMTIYRALGLDILHSVEYNRRMKLLFLSKKKGISSLSDELELPLMDILWTRGSMKGRDLYEEIRLTKNIAYTTALTVLDRLSKKGFIKKDRRSGVILFSPSISKETYTSAITGKVLVFNGLSTLNGSVSPTQTLDGFTAPSGITGFFK